MNAQAPLAGLNASDATGRMWTVDMTDVNDPYLTGICRWWHLSQPSPELRWALERRWLAPPGRALDLGCGLGTETRFLADAGFMAVGVDLSAASVHQAKRQHNAACFTRGDVLHLPFGAASFDLLVDRGCFHYLTAPARSAYAAEARRVLRPKGRLFLRACLCRAGRRNDIDASNVLRTFAGWRCLQLDPEIIPSDTRGMDAIVALLERDA